MRVGLVCIAKDEDNYIQEWINYHKKIGFDEIFIYQNNWRFNKEIPNVTKFKFDGYLQQLNAYNHFINKNFWNFDWVAFFDIDEFLVLKKHLTVKEFLLDYQNYNAIGINWVFFGDNGIKEVTDYSSIKRFTKREKSVWPAVKCITRLSNSQVEPKYNSVHHPNLEWVDCHKRPNKGPTTKIPSDDIAQINHYWCKTQKEFEIKCRKGRAVSQTPLTNEMFNNHNHNQLEDFTAFNFYFNR